MPNVFRAPAAPPAGVATPEFTGPARQIRVDVLEMIASLTAVAAAAALTDEAARTKAFAAARDDAIWFFTTNQEQVTGHLRTLTELVAARPELSAWTGDRMARIENDWDFVSHHWPKVGAPMDAAVADAAKVGLRLDQMSRTIAWMTIPSRVVDRLAHKRTGEKLVFADEFGDELPDAADQAAILTELKRQSRPIPGWIRPDDGVIYKASRRPWGRASSVAVVGGLAAVPFGLLLLGDRLDGTTAALHAGLSLRDILGSYAVALVGAVAHLFLAYRRNEKRDLEPILGEWLLWVNVKQASILVSVVTLMATVVLGAWAFGDLDTQTAALLGYSADSAFDLLVDRFTAKADAARKALPARITPAPVPAPAPA